MIVGQAYEGRDQWEGWRFHITKIEKPCIAHKGYATTWTSVQPACHLQAHRTRIKELRAAGKDAEADKLQEWCQKPTEDRREYEWFVQWLKRGYIVEVKT